MSPPDTLLDTSAAVALVMSNHTAHEATLEFLSGQILGLSGHAWFETYSVLTRMPGPERRRPLAVRDVLDHNFPESRFLSAKKTIALAGQLAKLGITGGAVYDSLVGATAAEYDLPLTSRDQRAAPRYLALGVRLILIEP
ncbi:MAG: type II toxin-antitoxin system VapC family toxin [Salinisphaera sp.]|nr:type II toxin-antitoxin system VapC family toxin [Salinisphaera sp.]MDN5937846.1 type II toxin-antitoxin system VapC family toxin [Salinisphaera sp.]